jgi:hypothetical protein
MSVLGQYLPKSDVCVTSVQPSCGPSGPFELVEALNGVIATIGGETPILRQGPFRWRQSNMQKDELINQLLKIGLGLVFAAYFVWWSLEVLSRLPPH